MMVRQVEVAEYGAPEVLQPKTAVLGELGERQVLVRHTAISVNFVDVYQRSGLYRLLTLPAVLGLEATGIVEAVGNAVAHVRLGDSIGYTGPLGGYASYRLLDADRAVHLPDAIDHRLAAGAMLRGLTAHMLLTVTYPVREGTRLLVLAAAGGLGQTITRWAKRLGADVIGVVGSEAKVATARSAGADLVLLRDEPHFNEAVLDLTAGGPELIVDGIGGPRFLEHFDLVRPLGMIASVGRPAGAIADLPMSLLARRFASVSRPSVLAFAADPVRYRAGMAAVMDALADGLTPSIGIELPLAEAAQAHRELESGRTTGSTLLIP